MTEKINPALVVGVEIIRDRGKKWAKLHQTDYTTRLLEKYSMLDSRTADTPMDPGTAKAFMMLPLDGHTEESLSLFRAILGCLLWLQQRTRHISTSWFPFLGECRIVHRWRTSKSPQGDLNGTRDHGLVFQSGEKEWRLSGSSDADLAGDLNTSRSTLSVHTQLGEYGCIHNGASLERKICTSTGQAET